MTGSKALGRKPRSSNERDPSRLSSPSGPKEKPGAAATATRLNKSSQARHTSHRTNAPPSAHPVMVGGCLVGHEGASGRGLRVNKKICAQRISEIKRLIHDRCDGPCVTDDAELWLDAIASPIIDTNRAMSLELLTGFAGEFTPMISKAQIASIHRRHMRRTARQDAEAMALKLLVTFDERKRLRIRTIGSCDVSRVERLQRAQAEKVEKQRQRRRERGVRPRDEVRANSLKARADASGISVSTLQRRIREASAT